MRNKIRISGGDHRGGSKVQVEVGIEADEQSEKLVRNTDVVFEDGEIVLLKVIQQDEKGDRPVSGPTWCELLMVTSQSKTSKTKKSEAKLLGKEGEGKQKQKKKACKGRRKHLLESKEDDVESGQRFFLLLCDAVFSCFCYPCDCCEFL